MSQSRSQSLNITKKVGSLVAEGVVTFPHSTVTQATSITTGVTATGSSGIITTVSSTLAAVTSTGFTVTNTDVLSTSVVVASLVNYGGTLVTNGIPVVTVSAIAAGSFDIKITNAHASNALSGVMKISYIVV